MIRRLTNLPQNKNTCKIQTFSRVLVGPAESDCYLISKLAKAGRNRVIEFGQVSPTHIIVKLAKRGMGSGVGQHNKCQRYGVLRGPIDPVYNSIDPV